MGVVETEAMVARSTTVGCIAPSASAGINRRRHVVRSVRSTSTAPNADARYLEHRPLGDFGAKGATTDANTTECDPHLSCLGREHGDKRLVDQSLSEPARPQLATLRQRSHRRRVVRRGSSSAGSETTRTAASCRATRGRERDIVRTRDRLPLERPAFIPSAQEHHLRLLRSLAIGPNAPETAQCFVRRYRGIEAKTHAARANAR